MVQEKWRWSWLFVVLALAGFLVAGCACKTPKPGEEFACVPDAKLEKTISPEAQLETLSCVIKDYDGKDTLYFNVTLKNISSEEQRYKVNIFLDNDKAVGGLIPQKTKDGLVKPGESASFAYPVAGMAQRPKSIMLMIKTMSK